MRARRDERARVRGAQRGSASDLEALFRLYWPRAHRAAYLVTHDAQAAEDIAQESFLAAIRALDTFDRRRPFGPWLHRIVVNRSIDWARARRLRAEVELDEEVASADPRADLGGETVAALARLAPRQRAVIVMRYLLEFAHGEIAEALVRGWRIGNPRSHRHVLVVGCIHGNECAGMAITQRLVNLARPIAFDLWVVQDVNPDGLVADTRQNAHRVDLNRNFGSQWKRIGRPGSFAYSGPRPWSGPETRTARSLVRRIHPQVTIWYHQPQALVRAWGPSIRVARRYARLARVPFHAIPWPNGTAPNWQNHLGEVSFVVELPPGQLSAPAADRYANAILRLLG